MTHDEMIAVIQAHKEGKTVLFREIYRPSDSWAPVSDDPAWNFQLFLYRIKPEPRVIWVNEYSYSKTLYCYMSEAHAKNSGGSELIATSKFVEVIE